MWDMATPVMVGGKHVGNLFMGQFLFADEEPDYDVSSAPRPGSSASTRKLTWPRSPRSPV